MTSGGRALLALGGVVALAVGAVGAYLYGSMSSSSGATVNAAKVPPAELRLERSDRAYPVTGVISANGAPLSDATVAFGDQSIYTDSTGEYSLANVPLGGTVSVKHPGYMPTDVVFDGASDTMDVTLPPRVIRAIHISSTWAVNDAEIQRLIDLANVTTVNAFLFDAMGDDGFIDYNTKVQAAIDHHMITDTPYDVSERLSQAKAAGLYTIIRVTAFANPLYVKAFPQQALGGGFVDPANHDAWEYPLDLAVEACKLGFDEVNFDYIRYPSNFYAKTPLTEAGRVANIQAFLQEAANRLHALGCAISANSFGGPTMVNNDYGIGQLIENFTIPLDVYAPMTYPELWKSPYFGFQDPPNHPKEVVAAQLDSAAPRIAKTAIMRPWLRASFYPDNWISWQIQDAETRGLGWIMWSSFDSPFRVSSFPAGTTGAG